MTGSTIVVTVACFHPDPGFGAHPDTVSDAVRDAGLARSPDSAPTNFAADTTAMRLLGRLPLVRSARLTGDR